LDAGSHPTILTSDDPYSPADCLPSPEGKRVAYPAYVNKGTSIYTIDLKPLLKLPK
jgi:hypothetical protein